jgi:hypothetical protein
MKRLVTPVKVIPVSGSCGATAEIDRSDRQDLSLFGLGWDFLERRLALFDPIPSVSIPNFCLVSSGQVPRSDTLRGNSYSDLWAA